MKANTKWVDIAKLVAILAVMTDHCYGILYTNDRIAYLSYFSVSLFILCMGITSYWSYERYEGALYKKILQKCIKICVPYAVATAIYVVFSNHFFAWKDYVDHLFNFNASAPFYYVCLYVGLTIVSPIIFAYFKWTEMKKHVWIWYVIGFVVTVAFSIISVNYTNIKGIYGGGGVLFGGTYVILLYLGMIFGKKVVSELSFRTSLLTSIGAIIATVICWLFICNNRLTLDYYFPFGKGLNPPGISLMIYAIFVLIFIYSIGNLADSVNSVRFIKIYDKIASLGKHTLYIFLYHRLFIDFIIPFISDKFGVCIEVKLLKALLYFAIMIGGSIAIECLFKTISSKIVKIYSSFER